MGLMRSARSEHPERLSLIDLDDSQDSQVSLHGALSVRSRTLRSGRARSTRRVWLV